MATLDHEDIKAIAHAITGGVLPEDHMEQHEFVKQWIAREQRKQEFRERVKQQVGGWMIITLMGAIGTGTWKAFQYLQDHLK